MHINPLFWHQSFIWMVDYSVEGPQGGFRGWLGRTNNYLARLHHFTKMGDLGHKTSLNLPFFFIEVSVPSLESESSCICVPGASVVSLYIWFSDWILEPFRQIFWLDFRTVQTDFLIGFLEPFRQIFWLDFGTVQTDFLIGFWNRSDRFWNRSDRFSDWILEPFRQILEPFRQIFCFSFYY
jgi:hypothetical protein